MANEGSGEQRGFTIVEDADGADATEGATGSQDSEGLPPVDFATFCLSLGTSALYHLGVIGDPETGKPVAQPNRDAARHTIDTLEMLRDKTEGNLDEEETKLLNGLLYELRMRYVEAGKAEH